MGLLNNKDSKRAELIKILVDKYGYEVEKLESLTNAKMQGLIKQEEEDAKELERKSTRISRKRSDIKDSDMIIVMNGRSGGVFYKSNQTQNTYMWDYFGQQGEMEYGELRRMKNQYPTYINDCWIIILDKEVQEEFGLTKLYENIVMPEDIDFIFKKDIKELEVFLDNLPSGMKLTIANRAVELYKSRELESLKVKDLIEEKLGFSLEDNTPLKDLIEVKEEK